MRLTFATALTLFLLAIGCGRDESVIAPPTPQLTGPQIAFTSNRTGTGGIHLYNAATGAITRLTPAGTYDSDPAISPDGTRIAFVTPSGGRLQLMTMRVDGSDRKVCGTNLQLSATGPRWSPDGRRIAFTGVLSSGEHDVYHILTSGDSLHRVTSNGASTALDWSPTGMRILYWWPGYLGDVLPSGDSTRILIGPTGSEIRGADYSPDGTRFALIFYSTGAASHSIQVRDADGANPVVVTDSSLQLLEISPPSWSPDGSLIAFSAHVGTASPDIYTVTVTPADPQLLLAGTYIDQQPDWGPKP